MSEQHICREVQHRLRGQRAEAAAPELAEHLARCARCRSELAFDGLLAHSIAQLNVPEVDLVPSVLARLGSEPHPLTLVVQLGVLLVLGLTLGPLASALLPSIDASAASWLLDLSARAASVPGRALAVLAETAALLGDPAELRPELLAAGLAAVLVLNVRALRRVEEAGR